MAKTPQMPGEQKIDPATGLPPVLNNTNDDPNAVARTRERVIQATAMAATGGEGEIAPSPEIDAGPALRTAVIDGESVQVRVPPIRHNADVVKFGPESRLPKGTPVRQDGKACEGDEQPYGIVADILTPRGVLVNRVVAYDALEGQGS